MPGRLVIMCWSLADILDSSHAEQTQVAARWWRNCERRARSGHRQAVPRQHTAEHHLCLQQLGTAVSHEGFSSTIEYNLGALRYSYRQIMFRAPSCRQNV